MLPELFRIPFIDFSVYSYGVLMAVGILIGIWIAVRHAAEDGLDKQAMYSFALRVVIASLVGSRLLMVFAEWDSFGDVGRIFSMDFLRAGGVYYGGFLGGLAMAAYQVWRHRWPGWKVADAFAPGVAFGQFVGRLGCFAAGCCWGKPTGSWAGVAFTPEAHALVGVPIGVHLHPTQLYESAVMLLVFGFLMWLRRRRAYAGQIVLIYILLYAAARFMIEFYRDDPRGSVGPLSTSQFIAVVLAVGALAFLFARWRRGERQSLEPLAES